MHVKALVLAEEAGEVVKAVLNSGPDYAARSHEVRRETIQTLAVAWAILEAM
jgi:NTP pyrophosphatase (non-canonical NTP hydrolase)